MGLRLPRTHDKGGVGPPWPCVEYLFARLVDKVNLIEHYGLSHCNGCK